MDGRFDTAFAERILATAPAAWIAMDAGGAIAAFNAGAERMFGWRREAVMGRPLAEVLIPERDREAHRLGFDRYKRSGETAVVDAGPVTFDAMHADGTEIAVEVDVRGPEPGWTDLYHAFVRDVSAQRRRERCTDAFRAIARIYVAAPAEDPLLEAALAAVAGALRCEASALWTLRSDGTWSANAVAGEALGPPPRDLVDARLARADGWSTVWIPVALDGELIVVLQVSSRCPRRLGEDVAELLTPLGDGLGLLTHRRRSERRMRALNQRDMAILEASSEGILGFDAQARLVFGNPAALATLGIEEVPPRKAGAHALLHGDCEHAADGCELEAAIRAGLGRHLDGERFATVGGSIVVDATCVPAELDGGGGAVLTFRDVTEQRAFDMARAHDLGFRETVLASMEDGVATCDTKGRLTFFNRAMERLAGAPMRPVGPDAWAHEYGLRDPDTGQYLEEAALPLVRALRGEQVRGAQLLIGPPGSAPRLASVNAHSLLGAGGEVLGVVAVVRDITERRRAVNRMREAERLASLGTWEIELSGAADEDPLRAPQEWSPGLLRLVGLEPETTAAPTGELWLQHVHDEEREAVASSFEAAISGGAGRWDGAHRVVRADGELRHVRTMAEFVRDQHGALVRVLGMTQDCTDQVLAQAESQRDQARRRQEDRMQSLGQLAGGVAHDFNNLLAVILSSSEFVLEDLEDGSPVRSDVEEIRRAAQRAADLTRRLLVFSRREIVNPEPVDLAGLIRGLEGMLQRTLGQRLALRVEILDDVGPVRADLGQLEQVVINLALNARDAMPEGGTLAIRLDAVEVLEPIDGLEPGDYARLRVADTGVGMDPEVAAHVFEPFFTTKPKGRGTGLGLATVYGAVKEAGGAVSVASNVDAGAVFTILLPVSAAEARAEPAIEAIDAGGGARLRVLVVEDDRAVRQVVSRILESAGHTVLRADEVAEALRRLEGCDGEVDLLLTDVAMPGRSGWDLHVEVTRRWPRVCTVLMSGHIDDLVRPERVSDAGVGFLRKPFTARELLATVDTHARPGADEAQS